MFGLSVLHVCYIANRRGMNQLKKTEASQFVSVCSNAKLSPYTLCLDYTDFAKQFQYFRLKMP